MTGPRFAAIAVVMLLIIACSDNAIEERLANLSGREYLSLPEGAKRQLVSQSLARYTTWQFWKRPDLCDYVLNEQSLYTLYDQAAGQAQDNSMMFSFVVLANDECVRQGQLLK